MGESMAENESSLEKYNCPQDVETNRTNSLKRPAPQTQEDEAERIAARREANRIHALKSRQRSKAQLQDLQRKVEELSGEKSELERENAVLRAQVEVLQQQNLALTQAQRVMLFQANQGNVAPGRNPGNTIGASVSASPTPCSTGSASTNSISVERGIISPTSFAQRSLSSQQLQQQHQQQEGPVENASQPQIAQINLASPPPPLHQEQQQIEQQSHQHECLEASSNDPQHNAQSSKMEAPVEGPVPEKSEQQLQKLPFLPLAALDPFNPIMMAAMAAAAASTASSTTPQAQAMQQQWAIFQQQQQQFQYLQQQIQEKQQQLYGNKGQLSDTFAKETATVVGGERLQESSG